MKKKILSILTSWVMLASSLGITAVADYENVQSDKTGEITENVNNSAEQVEYHINPVYADLIKPVNVKYGTSENTMWSNFSNASTYCNAQTAADYVKECMKKRQKYICLILNADADKQIKNNHSYDEYFKSHYKNDNYEPNQVDILVEMALEHTGVQTEGDYIKWQYESVTSAIDNSNSNQVKIIFEPYYYTTEQQEQQVTESINAVLKSLDLNGKDDYTKCQAIYEYICKNIKYDYEHLYNYSYKPQFTSYAAIVDKVAVCQGIAVLLYRMLLAEGIDCRVVTSSYHAWNIVKIGNSWYTCDDTWDLAYANGAFSDEDKNGNPYDDYFLLCDNTLFDDKHLDKDKKCHTREIPYNTEEFNKKYPMSEYDYTYVMNNCNHEKFQWTITKPATCTEDGEKTGKCSVCGGKMEIQIIKATGHNYSEEWTIDKQPTCTESGLESHHCKNCGDKKDITEIAPTGHKYITKAEKPTCTKKGYTIHTCSACKKSYKDNYTNAVGHKYVKVMVVKPTVKSKGYTLYKCSACGETIKKNYVPALVSISKAKVSGIKNVSYTGKQIKPKITVKVGKTTLKNGRDYAVIYGKNKIGKAVVKIVGKGKYSGTLTKTFTIIPRKTSVAVSSKTKGKISAKIAKRSEAKKYQIQYAANKKFKGAKTVSTTAIKKTLNAKSKKIYYVRVRTVNGKYVSSWSGTKKIKVK